MQFFVTATYQKLSTISHLAGVSLSRCRLSRRWCCQVLITTAPL